jgi:hypothetical protein
VQHFKQKKDIFSHSCWKCFFYHISPRHFFLFIYSDEVAHAAHAGADEEEGSSCGAAGAAATGCGNVGVRGACVPATRVASADNRGTAPRVNLQVFQLFEYKSVIRESQNKTF